MKFSRSFSHSMALVGALTISGVGVAVMGASSARAETAAEAQKDRVDDRAKKEKNQIDDKANVDKARVDDRAEAKKDDIDRGKSSKSKKDTAGEEVTDAWITTKVKASFVGDKALKGADIHVDTDHKGILVLSGYVPNEGARAHAVAIAKDTKGVHRVDDKLEIKPAK